VPGIGILGGTGPFGRGLARRLAARGHDTLIGSRSAERATAVAARIHDIVPDASVRGTSNARAAEAPIVFVTAPFAALDDLLPPLRETLAHRIVVDVVNPLHVNEGLVEVVAITERSAAGRMRTLLPAARIVSALKTCSAADLERADSPIQGDVLVCGDDPAANDTIRELLEDFATRVVVIGPLALSRAVEHTTALLLNINRRYRADTSLRIVGLPL
jgi:NADPH-dependent F420 reductase